MFAPEPWRRQRGSARGQMQKSSAGKFHDAPLQVTLARGTKDKEHAMSEKLNTAIAMKLKTPASMRSADQERQALPVASDEKGWSRFWQRAPPPCWQAWQ